MKKLILLPILFMAVSFCVKAQSGGLMIKKSDKGLYLDHKVAPKEGLYAIGRLYNVNPKFIAHYNKIDLNTGLAIGQVIQIPLTDTNFTQKTKTGVPVYYVVSENESLSKVSQSNKKVTLQKLRDWNGLKSDNLSAGSILVVGFLTSKEMTSLAANSRLKELPVKQQEKQVVKPEPDRGKEVKLVPVDEKTTTKPGKTDETLVKNEPLKETRPEPGKTEAVPAVVKETVSVPVNLEQGYFKTSFDQQVKTSPPSKSATVTSGIFKTNSGWQDAKYYLLIDKVSTGTIVKVINPENNKAIYAKVLGEMNGIRQNEGLDIRISNAAASILGVVDTEKFILKVTY